jgi:hypothetical protein
VRAQAGGRAKERRRGVGAVVCCVCLVCRAVYGVHGVYGGVVQGWVGVAVVDEVWVGSMLADE